MTRIREFCKKEVTLCVAFAAAVISSFIVPPDSNYIGYMDIRTLALLYCLMVVVSGLRNAGAFSALSYTLGQRVHSARALGGVLVGLCFFSAMLVTNDVAILTFVPFAVVVLGVAKKPVLLAKVVVLQTIAANLGSMLTPVGNPQNLYLYSFFGISFGEFLRYTAPIWCLSGLILAGLLFLLPGEAIQVFLGEPPILYKKTLWLCLGLFAVCLLTVLRVLPWPIMLGIIVAVLAVYRWRMLLQADFFLLLTFVCFFVFSGNLGRIPAVDQLLRQVLFGHELLLGAGLSQVISNVPAAMVLSCFAENGKSLLLGVDIGGLGTPIASLASLIALKQYGYADDADTGLFMKWFFLLNFALLAVLLAAAKLLGA